MWEHLTAPIAGFSFPRMDFVMKRRKHQKGMMELAFASNSHSSYWLSEDVVMFTIMQICRPVVDKLLHYMSAQRPLPRLLKDMKALTPSSQVCLCTKALIRERCTGLSHECIVFFDQERLYMVKKSDDVTCRKKWSLPLTNKSKAIYGDDSFTLKVMVDDEELALFSSTSSVSSSSFSSTRQTSSTSIITSARTGSISSTAVPVSGSGTGSFSIDGGGGCVLLKAATTPLRDEWMQAINHTISQLPSSFSDDSSQFPSPNITPLLDLPGDLSVDYFNAQKSGFLHERTPKGMWGGYEGWTQRWCVLHPSGILSGFENTPKNINTAAACPQFNLQNAQVFSYEAGALFRFVSATGTAVEMRVKDARTFDEWLSALQNLPYVKVIPSNIMENSPSAVLIMDKKSQLFASSSSSSSTSLGSSSLSLSSSARGLGVGVGVGVGGGGSLLAKIEGYQLAMDEKGGQYATFVIQVTSSLAPQGGGGSSRRRRSRLPSESQSVSSIVRRRSSEFTALHRALRQIFSTDQLPTLPHNRIWNKFDPVYLKEKAVRLHGYLTEVCKRCMSASTPRGQAVILAFLDLPPIEINHQQEPDQQVEEVVEELAHVYGEETFR